MSAWLLAGIALGAGLVPCALACLRTDAFAALVALEVGGTVAALALIVLSVEFQREAFADLGLVLAVTSLGGALAFVRHLERH